MKLKELYLLINIKQNLVFSEIITLFFLRDANFITRNFNLISVIFVRSLRRCCTLQSRSPTLSSAPYATKVSGLRSGAASASEGRYQRTTSPFIYQTHPQDFQTATCFSANCLIFLFFSCEFLDKNTLVHTSLDDGV